MTEEELRILKLKADCCDLLFDHFEEAKEYIIQSRNDAKDFDQEERNRKLCFFDSKMLNLLLNNYIYLENMLKKSTKN